MSGTQIGKMAFAFNWSLGTKLQEDNKKTIKYLLLYEIVLQKLPELTRVEG